MRSIWYFVGLLLVTIGALVLAAGFVDLGRPAYTTLGHLRPGLWWGGLMIVTGAVFLASERRK